MPEFTSPLRDEIYRQNVFSVDLLELHFSTPQYLCTGPYDISVDTATAPNTGLNIYTAQGDFLNFDGVAEDFDVKVGKLSVTLSGVNDDLLVPVTSPACIGKRIVLYRCFLNLTTGAIVGNPVLLFDGQVNNTSVVETARSCTITIDAASLFADFERVSGRKTNNDSNWVFQGYQFDTTFEKSGFLKNTEILWGRTK
jgi:hypothetical protein